MFRGGTSLRMAWHDRQNRETTACRRLVEITLAIPCVGAAKRRVSAGKSKTGRRNLYHWIRVSWEISPVSVRVGCSEVTEVVRCGPGTVHGKRVASRFLPAVGDERTSRAWNVGPLDHWTAFLQGNNRAAQGGRDSGRDRY